ncbi:hypothetical protein QVD99_005299 [Batrachochytrium dendrobatidis]|nr:hypothetical protein O5D80_004366 [Batrachochytrium dendrobatidis]KAK5668263.1 hypothetical protein QVD99_005299 [Batrachochytrium dendrobatidis]
MHEGVITTANLLNLIRLSPWLVRKRIYQYAGLMTQYMHGELDLPLSRTMLSAIACDCFKNNYTDLVQTDILPFCLLYTWEFLFVHTEDMERIVLKKYCHPVAQHRLTSMDLTLLLQPDTQIFPEGYIAHLCHQQMGKTMIVPELKPVLHDLLQRLWKLYGTSEYKRIAPSEVGESSDFVDYAQFQIVELAAYLGDMDILCAHFNYTPLDWRIHLYDAAGLLGQIKVLEFLATKMNQLEMEVSFGGALLGGYLDDLKHMALVKNLEQNQRSIFEFVNVNQVACALVLNKTDAIWACLYDGYVPKISPNESKFTRGKWWNLAAFKDIANMSAKAYNLDLLKFCTHHNIGDKLDKNAFADTSARKQAHIANWLFKEMADGMLGTQKQIQELCYSYQKSIAMELQHEACQLGNLESFFKLKQQVCAFNSNGILNPWSAFILDTAMALGHIQIIDAILDDCNASANDMSRMVCTALRCGHVFLADYFIKRTGAKLNKNMIVAIAEGCCLESVKFLAAATGPIVSPKALEIACRQESITLVEYFVLECKIRVTDAACFLAVKHDCLYVVQFLFNHDRIGEFNWKSLWAEADSMKHVRIAQWLKRVFDQRE